MIAPSATRFRNYGSQPGSWAAAVGRSAWHTDAAPSRIAHLEFGSVPNALQGIPAVVLLLAATILEGKPA
jgi:hypothetical protein